MREIFVPTFRDRVVHHLLANWLRPKLEKMFIHDNYAGREEKGTLFGIRRAEKFMRQATQNYQKPAYVLKLDIASYFRSIPKERLWVKIATFLFSSSSGERVHCEAGTNDDPGIQTETTTQSEQNHICTFSAKSTGEVSKPHLEYIQGAKTRYIPGSSESLFSSRSGLIDMQFLHYSLCHSGKSPLKNPYLYSDLQEIQRERERESTYEPSQNGDFSRPTNSLFRHNQSRFSET